MEGGCPAVEERPARVGSERKTIIVYLMKSKLVKDHAGTFKFGLRYADSYKTYNRAMDIPGVLGKYSL